MASAYATSVASSMPRMEYESTVSILKVDGRRQNASMILFRNKRDLFEGKIKKRSTDESMCRRRLLDYMY